MICYIWYHALILFYYHNFIFISSRLPRGQKISELAELELSYHNRIAHHEIFFDFVSNLPVFLYKYDMILVEDVLMIDLVSFRHVVYVVSIVRAVSSCVTPRIVGNGH